MGNFSIQNAYLCGLVKRMTVAQRRSRNGSRGMKGCTNKFYLNIDNESILVCKQYFLKTFQISDGRLTRALKKDAQGCPSEEKRGKAISKNKTSDEILTHVKNHILSFPSYTSHYTRKHNPNRRYLDPHLNIRKMYHMFLNECVSNNCAPVKESIYRRVFSNENLHFHVPLKDTCRICDSLKLKIDASDLEEERVKLKNEHELHLRKADKARDSMKTDSLLAKDENIKNYYYVFSFDLQKALPFPVLNVSVAYYKRNLYCYNLGVHDLPNNKAHMYVWDETIASRGSQEIASCLALHIEKEAATSSHIIAYSDTCTGQNRNIQLALTWMKLVMSDDNNIATIDHKFLVSGHSYMQNDSDFGNIESAAKNALKYVPSDWYSIIENARRSNKFIVHRMNRENFKTTIQLEKSVCRRKSDREGEKVNWLNIQWIRFVKNKPFTMLFKNNLNESLPFRELDLTPIKPNNTNFKLIKQRNLYNTSRPISEMKKKT